MNPNHYCEICYDGFETLTQFKSHRRRHVPTCKVGQLVLERNEADAFDCPVDGCEYKSGWSSGTF